MHMFRDTNNQEKCGCDTVVWNSMLLSPYDHSKLCFSIRGCWALGQEPIKHACACTHHSPRVLSPSSHRPQLAWRTGGQRQFLLPNLLSSSLLTQGWPRDQVSLVQGWREAGEWADQAREGAEMAVPVCATPSWPGFASMDQH